ncbi:hypothetical protein Droror1_Dr00006526 [Drosera rotundifolia]
MVTRKELGWGSKLPKRLLRLLVCGVRCGKADELSNDSSSSDVSQAFVQNDLELANSELKKSTEYVHTLEEKLRGASGCLGLTSGLLVWQQVIQGVDLSNEERMIISGGSSFYAAEMYINLKKELVVGVRRFKSIMDLYGP